MSSKKVTFSRPNGTDIFLSKMLRIILLQNKVFAWENLPEEIPDYILEYLLFVQGKALFFNYGGHYFVTRLAQGGQLDAYGRLIEATPITVDGSQFPKVRIFDKVTIVDRSKGYEGLSIEKADAVLIQNNALCLSGLDLLSNEMERLNYIWKSIGIEEANIRIKKVLVAEDKNQRDALMGEQNRITDGINPAEVVYSNDPLLKSQNLGNPANGAKASDLRDLWFDYDKVFSLILDELGISNLQDADKAERLTKDEATSKDEYTSLERAAMLEFRQRACEQINKMFGLNVQCVSYFDHKAVEMAAWYQKQGVAPSPMTADQTAIETQTEAIPGPTGQKLDNLPVPATMKPEGPKNGQN